MGLSQDNWYGYAAPPASVGEQGGLALKSLHLWFLLSSLVLAGLFYLMPALPIALLGLKDVPLYVAVLLCLVARPVRGSATTALWALSLVTGYLLVAFVVSPAELFVKAASSRQLIVFFVLVLLGAMLGSTRASQLRLYRYIIYTGLWIVGAGVLMQVTDLLAGGVLAPYFEAKAIPVLESGYPFFFVEPVPEFLSPWIDDSGRIRLVSTLLDPINFGHTLVAWLCILACRPDVIPGKAARLAAMAVFLLALLLTFSKGAWLHLALTVVLINFSRSYLISLGALAGLGAAIALLAEQHLGLALHIAGLLAAFDSMSWFGFGLGMVGNYSTLFGQTHDSGIADSFVALILGQIGVVGAGVWGAAIWIVLRKVKQDRFLKSLLISQLLVSSLSENAFNFLSISTLGLIVGIEIAMQGRSAMAAREPTADNLHAPKAPVQRSPYSPT